MKSIEQIICDRFPSVIMYPQADVNITNSKLESMITACIEDYISQKPNKDEYRNLYTTLARAVESGDPLVIGLTVGQVVERLKTLSE